VAEATDEEGREGQPLARRGLMVADGLTRPGHVDLYEAMNHMLLLRKPSLVYDETPHSRKGPHIVVSGLLAVPHH
jgi:hypothetical protein